MFISSSVVLLCSTIAVIAAAPTKHDNSKRLIRVPFEKVAKPNGHRFTKRDPFQTSLYNDNGSQYLVNVNIGTPGQNFSVALDTGRCVASPPLYVIASLLTPAIMFRQSIFSFLRNLATHINNSVNLVLTCGCQAHHVQLLCVHMQSLIQLNRLLTIQRIKNSASFMVAAVLTALMSRTVLALQEPLSTNNNSVWYLKQVIS